MMTLNDLDNLIKEAGFYTSIVLKQPRINIYTAKEEFLGQFILLPDDQIWFSVFDTQQGAVTGEGGGCQPNVESIRNIVKEFTYIKY